jgi:large subunit ribosomal protein L30
MAKQSASKAAHGKSAVKAAHGKSGAKAAVKKLKITLLRSPIGFNRTQGKTVEGMGLRRIRHSVELPDTPETRGMILKVRHLIEVAE